MTTQNIKFESPTESLADSFASTPGTQYLSLFEERDTMDPSQVMTPQSYDDDSMFGSVAGTPAPEKKQVKKRKSWGQQLPEPKTNLPPRKRAKTEDEKEQRRVERVLRNRRAAQSSRERKRQEVEALEAEKQLVERRNVDLELQLQNALEKNRLLEQQVAQMAGGNMTVFRGSVASSPAAEPLRASTPVTITQDLFGSRDEQRTVNPASLSPEIRPVTEFTSNASSSDLTRHPAVMLCDLQCQSEEQRPWMNSANTVISQLLAMITFLNMTSAISTLLNPLTQILNSVNTGSPLSPTTSILTSVIWLTTTTASLTTSSSMTSSTTTTSLRPRFSLRIRLLRRLLACSPNLARPLMDATIRAMRLASEQQLIPSSLSNADASRHGDKNSPSVEALMTLLWAINVIEKERKSQEIPRLDAAAEIRDVRGELEELFRPRNFHSVLGSGSARDGAGVRQKSLDGWRTA